MKEYTVNIWEMGSLLDNHGAVESITTSAKHGEDQLFMIVEHHHKSARSRLIVFDTLTEMHEYRDSYLSGKNGEGEMIKSVCPIEYSDSDYNMDVERAMKLFFKE